MAERPKNFDFTGCRALAGVCGVVWIILAAVFLYPAISILRQPANGITDTRRTAVQMVVAIKQHITEYGSLLANSNAEMMGALRGENPRKIAFFEASAASFNPKGELIDRWGTPYRFDLSDSKTPRIWSCGKDRRDDGGAEGSDDIPSWR